MSTSIHEMVESKYTKKEDVGVDGKLVTFRSFRKQNVAMEGEPERIRIVATFDELPKPVVLNRTNLKKMAKLFGSETIDHWVGKQCVLFNDENVVFGGDEIGGIRVRAAPTKPNKWKSQTASDEIDDDTPQ